MKPPKLTEKHVQDAIDSFLELDGWRKIVTDPPHMRGLGVSEKGIPDRLYIRYLTDDCIHCPPKAGTITVVILKAPAAEVLWVEHKKRGGKAALHQKAWHAHERALGALVWVAGEDFPASIEGFQEHYMASGLNRRIAQPLLKVQLGRKANAD